MAMKTMGDPGNCYFLTPKKPRIPKIFIFLLTCICILASSGYASTIASVSQDIKSASELHAEGLHLYNEGKYREALDAWVKEFDLDPKNSNTANDIGIAYRMLGEQKAAIEYHQKAIELNPNFGKAYSGLGLAYFDLKEYEQAKISFLKAIELGYSVGKSQYNLGLSYLKLKDYERAKTALSKAIEFKHELSSSYYNLGVVYYEQKDYKQAIEAFDKVVKIDPSYPGIHYRLGECYRFCKKYYFAKKEFEKESRSGSRWAEPSLRAIPEIDQKFLAYIANILLWVIGPGVPVVMLWFLKNCREFFRPNKQKVILLASFLLFFPSPFYLILIFGFFPAFYSLGAWLEISVGMVKGEFGFLMAFLYYSILVFLNYLLVCLLFNKIENKKWVWAAMVVLILASFLNIYWGIGEGRSGSTNSIQLMKGVFSHFFE